MVSKTDRPPQIEGHWSISLTYVMIPLSLFLTEDGSAGSVCGSDIKTSFRKFPFALRLNIPYFSGTWRSDGKARSTLTFPCSLRIQGIP